MKTPMWRLTMFLARAWQAAWPPASASASVSGRECPGLLAILRTIAIALCSLLCAVGGFDRASAQSLTTYTTEASYTAALPAAEATTAVESFASVTVDRPVSTTTPDLWSGFTLLARGTSQFGPSAYCVSLRFCMGWTASPPALPGIYGAVAEPALGDAQLTFDLAPRAFGFGLDYWDWNDEGQRSQIRVTLSNGAIFNVTGPSTLPGDPGGFIGFRIDQASVNAGITITRVEWVALAGNSEIIGIRNVRVSTVNPLVVTNTNDSGAGSLRNAVQFANSQPTPSTITFAIPGAGPHTITLASALPDLTANGLTIDGTTQSGTQCRDLWAGSGHDLRVHLRGSGISGPVFRGSGQIIRGLAITEFVNGIDVGASSNLASVQCSYVGLAPNGNSVAGTDRGIRILGASARIGSLNPGEGNVISGYSHGIMTEAGSTDTSIQGNFIGTDPTGTAARPNTVRGINHFNGSATWRDITRNLISGNGGVGGIALETDDLITPSNGTIRIQRNVIGFNRTRSALLNNSGDGIFFHSGSISNVLIGGTATTEGNEISGGNDAIDLRAVNNVVIRGNIIARAASRGIWMAATTNVTIGGTAPGEGNTIGGNGSDGIFVGFASASITVLGNLIQPLTIAGTTAGNVGHGIWVERATTVMIGDGTAAGRNIIAGNQGRSIHFSETSSAITVNGNYIGTDATGNVSVAGGQSLANSARDAIRFEAANVSNVAILNNVIGGYVSAMIKFTESTASGVIIRGNNVGVGADGSSRIVPGTNESLIAFGGATRNYANAVIGGLSPGEGNLIANGGQNGITIRSAQSGIQVIGNTIRNNFGNGVLVITPTRAAIIANRISGNRLLGIDLDGDGVTANDPGDGDSGANDLLNFPQNIRAIVQGPNQLGYSFTLDAPAAADGYRIEFFANTAADPSGFGEGERLLGHVDIAHPGGAQSYTGTLTTLQPVAVGEAIATTSTRRTGSDAWDMTSEFSAAATADGVAQLAVAITSEVFDPPAGNAFATPGNDVLLTTTVTNTGNGSTDADSVFAVIAISPDASFFNAVTPALGGIVGFASGAPSLTFNPATDLRFSNAASPPQSLAECTYTPAASYDAQVRYVCLNPKGTLPSGSAQGQAQVRLRVRIN